MMELDCFEIENRWCYNYRGTEREILRKKTLKQEQSMSKTFWSHFKHFGRFLGKMYLFLTLSRHVSRHYWPVWCGHGAKFTPSVGEGVVGNWECPTDAMHPFSGGEGGSEKWYMEIVFFLATLNFQGHADHFFQISQPKTISLKNRYF